MPKKRLIWILLVLALPMFSCQLLMPDQAPQPTETAAAIGTPVEILLPTATQTEAPTPFPSPLLTETEVVSEPPTATALPEPTASPVSTSTSPAPTSTQPPPPTATQAPAPTEVDVPIPPTPNTLLVIATHILNETSEEKQYEIAMRYPILEWGGDSRVDAFNQASRAFAEDEFSGFKEGMVEIDPAAGTMLSTLYMDYEVTYNTSGLISVIYNVSYYFGGAAHPGYYSRTLNYLVDEGRILTLADLFQPGANYLDLLAQYSIDELRSRDVLAWEDGALPTEENYRNWNLTPQGLLITFDEYQVAPHAAGPQEVIIPYATLQPILRENGPVSRIAP